MIPPNNLRFTDFYSMIYLFEFSDMINISLIKSKNELKDFLAMKSTEFFFMGLPLDYNIGRLKVYLKGDLVDYIKYFERNDYFI